MMTVFFLFTVSHKGSISEYGATISKNVQENYLAISPVFSEQYQKKRMRLHADNAEHGVQNVGGIPYRNKTLIPQCLIRSLPMPLP